jgi:hypothetical protein
MTAVFRSVPAASFVFCGRDIGARTVDVGESPVFRAEERPDLGLMLHLLLHARDPMELRVLRLDIEGQEERVVAFCSDLEGNVCKPLLMGKRKFWRRPADADRNDGMASSGDGILETEVGVLFLANCST